MSRYSPVVSIVTPSYNQAQFLEETILSVLDQDYPNIEYIIIDGGSTDNSVNIIEKYKNRLAYWVSEADRGQSHAINKGWQIATGEIVAYLNSDDVYMPGAVATAVQALKLNPSVCMVYSDAIVIDEFGRFVRNIISLPFDAQRLLLQDSFVPQPTVFMRRQALDEVGMLDEDLYLAMDQDLWTRFSIKRPAIYLSNIYLAKYREYAAAKSSAALDKLPAERRRILNKMYNQTELPLAMKQIKAQAYSRLYFDQANRAARFNHPDQIMQPLLRSIFESPQYALIRSGRYTRLAARALFP